MVKLIKDMMAAGVLVTAIGAVVVAVIIFVPRLILLIEGVIK
jgi:diacylglycerol kinase